MSPDTHFGQIVKERRSALGLTQAELANRVGCAPITIRRIEASNLRPSFQMAELMALALMIPEAEQLGFVRLARQKGPETPIPKPTPSPGEIGMADLTGRSVKGFQLGELIGSGGFGVVYRAVQPSVKRDVAVKIILPRFANQPDFIRRFEAEAQLVARLEHPHIVPLYDYWREPDAAYLIMRMLRGGSLEDKLKSGPISMVDFQHIIPQISTALDIAHRNGVVHRDIKPANVMLDEEMNAYLTDFGIAKSLNASDESQLTQGGALIGSPAYISPEQILAEPLGPASDIYCLGIMLFEILTGKKPFPGPTPVAYIQQHINDRLPSLLDYQPDLPPLLDEVIQKATEKKPEDRYQSTLDLLAALEQMWDSSDSPSPVQITSPDLSTQELAALENPYRGLRPFTEADANNFHGRKGLVQELLVMLADGSDLSRFVAVVGPSGSGKSSVVKAGLIPALRRGGLPDSDNWFMVDLTPSSHPWEEVEAALLRVAVNPPDSLLAQLKDGSRGLLRAVRRILPDDDETELLLVIDQFEELFTLVEDEAIRAHFLESLLTAVLDPRSRLRLIITLRADFTDRPLQYVDFGELMRQRTVFVLPMTPNELTKAITRPITQLGMEMEPALVSTLLREVGDQPGVLPLLQYALTEMFEERQGRTLTLTDYETTGGVLGALARRADDIFNSLDAPAQEAARQLFLRLITLGEGVEDTRRRVLMSELDTIRVGAVREPPLQLDRVVDEYGRYRLLTFDHDPTTRSATVEVAHEALLREWPRLRSWLTDSREDVRRQRMLAEAAAQWQTASQESSYLLRGSRLTAFESWAETTTIALTENERGFLENSVAARDVRHAEEEARRQRELETAQKLAEEQSRRAEEQTKAAQTLRQRALFLTVASVVAVILAVTAFGFARSSTNNANLAITREAEALTNLNLATTNEAEAVVNANLASTREAEAEAERDRADGERETAVIAQQLAQDEANSRATAEAIAIDEREIAQQQLQLTTSRELALAANANLESNPERSLLLALQALDTAYTTEAEEMLRGALQASRVELTLTEGDESVKWVAYHPDGTWLAGIAEDGILFIWDAESGEKLQTIPLDITGVSRLAISPDGSLLAVAYQSKILLLDTNSLVITQTLDKHLDNVMDIEFSPDSRLLASGGRDGLMKIWQVASGEEQLSVTASDTGWVNDVTFSRDGSRIATGGDDLTARIWDAATGEELVRMVHSANARWVNYVAFNADATRLFTTPAASGNLRGISIWNIETITSDELTEPVAEWLEIHPNLLTEISLSPDGRFLATSSQDSTVKLWDATSDTAEEILTLSGHRAAVLDIAFAPDGQKMVTTSNPFGTARIWDISKAGSGELLNIADSSFPIAFSPDNKLLITNSSELFTAGESIIKIWDVETGDLLEEFDSLITLVKSSAVSPNGRYLAVGGDDGVVKIWDITTQQEVSTIVGHGSGVVGGVHEGVLGLDFSPDGTLLATGGADGYVIVWDVETSEKIYEWRVDPRNSFFWQGDGERANGVTNVKFSPNGRFVAASTDENSGALIKIWDLESGAEITVVEDIRRRIWGLAFSPDSTRIAGTGGNGIIKVWDVASGAEVANLEGVTVTIPDVLFSADGSRLFTGRNEIIVWDLETEEALFKLPQGQRALVLSPNGQYLAAAGEKGIHIYALDFEEVLEIARSRVTRTLTDAECKEYLHIDVCPVD